MPAQELAAASVVEPGQRWGTGRFRDRSARQTGVWQIGRAMRAQDRV